MNVSHRPSLGFVLGDSWLGIAALCLLLEFTSRFSTFSDIAELSELWQSVLIRFVGSFVSVGIVIVAGKHLPAGRNLRWALLVLVVILAAALGACASTVVEIALGMQSQPVILVVRVYAVLTVPALVAALGEFQRLRESARSAMEDERLRAATTRDQLVEARLQLLQAQIEPHFLFNSLANVRRLSKLDAPAGKALLLNLLRYLESALPRMRDSNSTVAKEVELARAFLAVHQVRMGPRLAYSFDVPSEFETAVLPSMMLLTLLENALKHGIGPLAQGGQIDVRISRMSENRLRLTVADTGKGLQATYGQGVGLANIRSRLRAMFGEAGSLSLSLNEPRGVSASIVWPEDRP